MIQNPVSAGFFYFNFAGNMNYLSVENISRVLSDKVLFSDLSFGLNKGEKVGLIARNGAGKSSLLSILAGKEEADAGNVVIRNDIRIGFLEQHPSFMQSLSIQEFIEKGHSEVFTIIHDYKTAIKNQTENFNPLTHQAFEEASHKMDVVNGWDYERKLVELLYLFKITDLSQNLDTLSGGQKKRLAIALVLLDDPDILLLDEPTNHLDIEMIEWLEKLLSQSNSTLLVVTHDRYFLDAVCDRIIELEQGKLYNYKGNYKFFLEKKAERIANEKTETEKARQLMKKELEWIRRMPKARTTKSKARIDSFQVVSEKASQNRNEKSINLGIKMARVGGKILEVDRVTKKFDDKVILDNFEYIFKRGERAGVIGKNGSGKSTFLNILSGMINPDHGSVTRGETTIFGYYTQEGLNVDESKRVIDVVKEIAEVVITPNGTALPVAQYLQYFLFTNEMQYTLVSKLSGGEKRRLHLLTVLIKNPNFLILDEPTNDLDIDTLNKLEEFLLDFKGCLILVSHDRYFLDKLVDHLFIFKGDGNITDYYGTYSEYKVMVEKQGRAEIKTSQNEVSVKEEAQSVTAKPKTKLTYKEKLELENLEKEIASLESEKSELENSMMSGSLNYEQLEINSKRITNIMADLDHKTERWIYLESYNE